MKESYERTELTITEFQQEDVIMTSEESVDPIVQQPSGKFMLPIR